MPLLRIARFAALLAASAVVAGCTGLATLQSFTTPAELYDLTPKSTFDDNLPTIESQLVVEEPTAASSVNTDRIAVKPSAFEIRYFPNARWVDRAPLLVQTLLVESFENTGKVRSVGRRAIGLTSDYTLVSELREFQAQVGDDPGAPVSVNVQLNLKVVAEPDGLIVASESFGREMQAESDAMLDVVAAFDEALGKSMRDAVEWAVRRIAEINNRNRS